jgi:hypothetical protein
MKELDKTGGAWVWGESNSELSGKEANSDCPKSLSCHGRSGSAELGAQVRLNFDSIFKNGPLYFDSNFRFFSKVANMNACRRQAVSSDVRVKEQNSVFRWALVGD